MLSSKKNIILNQYKTVTLDSILTSQFVYSAPEEIINLKALRLELKSKKNQKLHFFYL
jgi:hypothetical protein